MKNVVKCFLVLLSIFILVSCYESSSNIGGNGNFRVKNKTAQIQLGSEVKAEIRSNSFEAVQFYVVLGKDTLLDFTNSETYFHFYLNDSTIGKKRVSIIGINEAGDSKKKVMHVEVFSNVVPVKKAVTILREYSHNTNDYIQGLFFDGDTLFEGTGLYGRSRIKKYLLNTDNVLVEKTLDDQLFGEGITLLNDKVYELTWKSGKVLVYNRSFELLDEMLLPFNAEGWGLTNDGVNLIMSDGTEKIRFLKPIDLSIVNEIQVYDNQRKLNSLNELELLEDKLYANIYQSNYIVEIDVNTGIVLSYIDCSYLEKKIERNVDTDVLNGIAYNTERKTFFFTGKKWSKLFEVSF